MYKSGLLGTGDLESGVDRDRGSTRNVTVRRPRRNLLNKFSSGCREETSAARRHGVITKLLPSMLLS